MKRYLKYFTIGLLFFGILPWSAFANVLTVDEVLASDLIRFGDWTTRITGISVPDVNSKLSEEAKNFATETLDGKAVKVFTLTTNDMASGIVRGEDGYPFATLHYGENMDQDYAVSLLERGFAKVDKETLQPDQEHYLEAEKKAMSNKLGIWSEN